MVWLEVPVWRFHSGGIWTGGIWTGGIWFGEWGGNGVPMDHYYNQWRLRPASTVPRSSWSFGGLMALSEGGVAGGKGTDRADMATFPDSRWGYSRADFLRQTEATGAGTGILDHITAPLGMPQSNVISQPGVCAHIILFFYFSMTGEPRKHGDATIRDQLLQGLNFAYLCTFPRQMIACNPIQA